MREVFRDLSQRFGKFEREAREHLAKHEGSPDRVITLHDTQARLAKLSLLQEDLFHQALKCIEVRLYRAAVVIAWAGFMDFLEAKMAEDGLVAVHAVYPAWHKHKTIEDLREAVVEHQLLEASQKIRLLRKTDLGVLKGCLAKRNECAHPSAVQPGMNDCLGYVYELLTRIERLQDRSPKVP